MKFEHMVVTVIWDDYEEMLGVALANGEVVYKTEKLGGILGGISITYPPLHEFLSELGQRGWEVCCSVKIDTSRSLTNHGNELILKRQVA